MIASISNIARQASITVKPDNGLNDINMITDGNYSSVYRSSIQVALSINFTFTAARRIGYIAIGGSNIGSKDSISIRANYAGGGAWVSYARMGLGRAPTLMFKVDESNIESIKITIVGAGTLSIAEIAFGDYYEIPQGEQAGYSRGWTVPNLQPRSISGMKNTPTKLSKKSRLLSTRISVPNNIMSDFDGWYEFIKYAAHNVFYILEDTNPVRAVAGFNALASMTKAHSKTRSLGTSSIKFDVFHSLLNSADGGGSGKDWQDKSGGEVTINKDGTISITGEHYEINLFELADRPEIAIDITFVFDGATIGSTNAFKPSIRAGNFRNGSNIKMIFINESKTSAIGGDGGYGADGKGGVFGELMIDPTHGFAGGITYESDDIETEIYLNYGTINGYVTLSKMYAAGGGGGGDWYLNQSQAMAMFASGGGGNGIPAGNGGIIDTMQSLTHSESGEAGTFKEGGKHGRVDVGDDMRAIAGNGGSSESGGDGGDEGNKGLGGEAGGSIRGKNVTVYNLSSLADEFTAGYSHGFTLIDGTEQEEQQTLRRSIYGEHDNINLFDFMLRPLKPVYAIFFLDEALIGSTDINTPSISAEGFHVDSIITIVFTNDSKVSAIGGDCYNSNGIETHIFINYEVVLDHSTSGLMHATGGGGAIIGESVTVYNNFNYQDKFIAGNSDVFTLFDDYEAPEDIIIEGPEDGVITVTITGDYNNINLFELAGSPNIINVYEVDFVFDGVAISSNNAGIPSIRAGGFSDNMAITLMLINGSTFKTIGAGTVYQSDDVQTFIALNQTGVPVYDKYILDGYMYAGDGAAIKGNNVTVINSHDKADKFQDGYSDYYVLIDDSGTVEKPEPELKITITGENYDLNLFSRAGSPSAALNVAFVFDAVTIGSTNIGTPAIRAGNFATGTVIKLIFINDSKLSAIGGDGGLASSFAASQVEPQNGGVTYESDDIETKIYLNYGTVDTFDTSCEMYAAGGGGAGGMSFSANYDLAATSGGGGNGIPSGEGIGDYDPLIGRVGDNGTFQFGGNGYAFTLGVASSEGGDGGTSSDGLPASGVTVTSVGLSGAAIKGTGVTVYNLAADVGKFAAGNSDAFTLIQS